MGGTAKLSTFNFQLSTFKGLKLRPHGIEGGGIGIREGDDRYLIEGGELIAGALDGGVGAAAGAPEDGVIVLLGAGYGEPDEDEFLRPLEGFGQGEDARGEPPWLN
jgi:hypothetical protein